MHNQKKDNNQFKNNKQSEVPENPTTWNSDNQGVKETFIQTGRRGWDGQLGEEDLRRGKAVDHTARRELADRETKGS